MGIKGDYLDALRTILAEKVANAEQAQRQAQMQAQADEYHRIRALYDRIYAVGTTNSQIMPVKKNEDFELAKLVGDKTADQLERYVIDSLLRLSTSEESKHRRMAAQSELLPEATLIMMQNDADPSVRSTVERRLKEKGYALWQK